MQNIQEHKFLHFEDEKEFSDKLYLLIESIVKYGLHDALGLVRVNNRPLIKEQREQLTRDQFVRAAIQYFALQSSNAYPRFSSLQKALKNKHLVNAFYELVNFVFFEFGRIIASDDVLAKLAKYRNLDEKSTRISIFMEIISFFKCDLEFQKSLRDFINNRVDIEKYTATKNIRWSDVIAYVDQLDNTVELTLDNLDKAFQYARFIFFAKDLLSLSEDDAQALWAIYDSPTTTQTSEDQKNYVKLFKFVEEGRIDSCFLEFFLKKHYAREKDDLRAKEIKLSNIVAYIESLGGDKKLRFNDVQYVFEYAQLIFFATNTLKLDGEKAKKIAETYISQKKTIVKKLSAMKKRVETRAQPDLKTEVEKSEAEMKIEEELEKKIAAAKTEADEEIKKLTGIEKTQDDKDQTLEESELAEEEKEGETKTKEEIEKELEDEIEAAKVEAKEKAKELAEAEENEVTSLVGMGDPQDSIDVDNVIYFLKATYYNWKESDETNCGAFVESAIDYARTVKVIYSSGETLKTAKQQAFYSSEKSQFISDPNVKNWYEENQKAAAVSVVCLVFLPLFAVSLGIFFYAAYQANEQKETNQKLGDAVNVTVWASCKQEVKKVEAVRQDHTLTT